MYCLINYPKTELTRRVEHTESLSFLCQGISIYHMMYDDDEIW